jgi:hypothetical protein
MKFSSIFMIFSAVVGQPIEDPDNLCAGTNVIIYRLDNLEYIITSTTGNAPLKFLSNPKKSLLNGVTFVAVDILGVKGYIAESSVCGKKTCCKKA